MSKHEVESLMNPSCLNKELKEELQVSQIVILDVSTVRQSSQDLRNLPNEDIQRE